MPERVLSLRDVLSSLQARGLLHQVAVGRIGHYLPHARPTTTTPWYVNLLVAIGAWVAAICFVAFLGVADLLTFEGGIPLVWGLGFIAGATVLHFYIKPVFAAQLALALSMAGHVMALLGTSNLLEDGLYYGILGILPETYFGCALAAEILCPVLYRLYSNWLHRFLSCLLVMITATAWVLSMERHHGLHVLVLVETIGIGLLMTKFHRIRCLRPMAYALAVSLPLTLLLVLAPHGDIETPWWPSKAILTLGLIWLCQWAAGGPRNLRREPIILAALAAAVLGAVSTPGILAGVGLIILGYAQEDRPLLGLGIVFFPAFIIAYYYDLDVTLLTKSWILLASGAILLLGRSALGQRPWAREEKA